MTFDDGPTLQLKLADVPAGKGVALSVNYQEPYVMLPWHVREMADLLRDMAERAETAQGWK